jgi:hypothetical protein
MSSETDAKNKIGENAFGGYMSSKPIFSFPNMVPDIDTSGLKNFWGLQDGQVQSQLVS